MDDGVTLYSYEETGIKARWNALPTGCVVVMIITSTEEILMDDFDCTGQWHALYKCSP